jgi:hypothetical protein
LDFDVWKLFSSSPVAWLLLFQAAIKKGNRRCEELLQTTEFLLSMLIAQQGADDTQLKR